MERTIVWTYLYPVFLTPPPTLNLTDQFAFRPTGSPSAAIIYLLHTVTNMLLYNVIVISLDFSKASDSVRHCTLLDKIAKLDIPAHVYNWLAEFFIEHSHCTVYNDQTATLKTRAQQQLRWAIVATITLLECWLSSCYSCVKWDNVWSELFHFSFGVRQGSVLSPYLFAVYLDDLTMTCLSVPGVYIVLYTDDILLIAPSVCGLDAIVKIRELELSRLDYSK